MSTDKSKEECWAIQLAYHLDAGTEPPTKMRPEDVPFFREVLGDEAVEAILAEAKEGT